MYFSKCKKLQRVLEGIEEQLLEMGGNEVERYMKSFPGEPDYNIAAHGNLLIYYAQVRRFYEKAGYKSVNKWSDQHIWETYRRQVGYVARELLKTRI